MQLDIKTNYWFTATVSALLDSDVFLKHQHFGWLQQQAVVANNSK